MIASLYQSGSFCRASLPTRRRIALSSAPGVCSCGSVEASGPTVNGLPSVFEAIKENVKSPVFRSPSRRWLALEHREKINTIRALPTQDCAKEVLNHQGHCRLWGKTR